VLVRFNHVASVIANANHSAWHGDGKRYVVRANEKLTAFLDQCRKRQEKLLNGLRAAFLALPFFVL
jgi:hypothetical protein